ncbi:MULTISPECIES: N-acetylglucosamine-6-phosphate deacetylase [Anaerotruncus]|uniref:N-acetylglucosamine-6-phosphate deacetylase n=2 Tax=Oscillospiraceae TaxID=216572 RepID=UPI00083781C9|nr:MULTISPECIES: N-acetylglucosamine-6-phosphate deacetylase [Anaerotruncus]RGX55285.1 N-acetylglucosamine-6-phosphate deacetylase [Anaerotruncus sp. AF02-27]
MKTFVNARLVLPDGVRQNGFLKEDAGKILSFGDMDNSLIGAGEIIDCGGRYLAPGFIDIHSHGGGGFDYMDGSAEDIVGAARAHLRHGTTSVLPTTMTSSDEDLFLTIDNFKEAKKVRENMPDLLGLHLEGPYFDMVEKGAQPDQYIQNPRPEHYMKVMERADGCIKRWSLAPELPGALEMADRLLPMGVMLAAGHTAATYDQMKEAFDHGIRHLTHFYSGMSTIVRKGGFRVLGVVESGYLIDGLTVELIADGMHLPPVLLRLILKCKNHDEICLCTDSMRGAGMPEGPSILGPRKGGQDVIIEGGIAKMPDRTCFAGSVATTDRLVRVMVYEAGLPIWEAVKMASLLPAKFIGEDGRKGSIEAGKDADLVLFDEDINVSAVYVGGVKANF